MNGVTALLDLSRFPVMTPDLKIHIFGHDIKRVTLAMRSSHFLVLGCLEVVKPKTVT